GCAGQPHRLLTRRVWGEAVSVGDDASVRAGIAAADRAAGRCASVWARAAKIVTPLATTLATEAAVEVEAEQSVRARIVLRDTHRACVAVGAAALFTCAAAGRLADEPAVDTREHALLRTSDADGVGVRTARLRHLYAGAAHAAARAPKAAATGA